MGRACARPHSGDSLSARGPAPDQVLPSTTTARDGLSAMLLAGGAPIGVAGPDGHLLGVVTLDLLMRTVTESRARTEPAA